MNEYDFKVRNNLMSPFDLILEQNSCVIVTRIVKTTAGVLHSTHFIIFPSCGCKVDA